MDSFVISDTSVNSFGTIRSTRTRWAEQAARIEDIKRCTEFYSENSEGGKHT